MRVSIGAQAGYLLGVKEIGGEIPKFGDRFDLKVRLNANLGNYCLKLPSNVDVYPGLNIGLKISVDILELDISSIKVWTLDRNAIPNHEIQKI